MERKYFIWKNKECNGVNPKWIQLTGKEFYSFIRNPENNGRKFVKLHPQNDYELDLIIIEANEEEYKKWEKDESKRKYLNSYKGKYEIVSESSFVDDDGTSLYDRISNEEMSLEDTVEQALVYGDLYNALDRLTDKERELIYLSYFKSLSKTEIGKTFNVSQQYISKQIKKIQEKIKSWL